MAAQDPSPLAERIFEMFSDHLVDWVSDQGPFTAALVFAVIWITWKLHQQCQERPEWHFFLDLVVDTLLAVAFSRFIEVFTDEIVVHAEKGSGFASTAVGHWVIMGMEALHFIPFFLLFVFQTLKLYQLLRQKLRHR